jgi:hypothetical protein
MSTATEQLRKLTCRCGLGRTGADLTSTGTQLHPRRLHGIGDLTAERGNHAVLPMGGRTWAGTKDRSLNINTPGQHLAQPARSQPFGARYGCV